VSGGNNPHGPSAGAQGLLPCQGSLNPANARRTAPRKDTFPNPHHTPAMFSQATIHQPVTLSVAMKFALPESAVGFRLGRVPWTA